MYAKNCEIADLERALSLLNKDYGDNVCWNQSPEHRGNRIIFTLRVKDSRGPGHRLGFNRYDGGNQRHLISACWHVHGDFFEYLFEVNPKAEIKAGKKTITDDDGNWQDWNIGSQMYPMYYSEACEC